MNKDKEKMDKAFKEALAESFENERKKNKLAVKRFRFLNQYLDSTHDWLNMNNVDFDKYVSVQLLQAVSLYHSSNQRAIKVGRAKSDPYLIVKDSPLYHEQRLRDGDK